MQWKAQLIEVVYVDRGANSDKFYRSYRMWDEDDLTQNRVLFQWGRRGSKGQSQNIVCSSVGQAVVVSNRKIQEKLEKGYAASRDSKLEAVPTDLLLLAGVAAFDGDALHKPVNPFDRFIADADVARRLAMGTDDDQSKAVVALSDLRSQLEALRQQVLEAEGHLEIVNSLVLARLGA